MYNFYINYRLRRLRRKTSTRELFQETNIRIKDLIFPIFIEECIKDYKTIKTMPGIMRIPEHRLAYEIERIVKAGIIAIITFGISHNTDYNGSDTWNENGLISRILNICKKTAPEIVVISDTCFCQYTNNGHCGVISDQGIVDNDATLLNLQKQAIVAAQAGADFIAPSSCMDGQVTAIRNELDLYKFTDTAIMSYSAKFASALYGPFRDAAGTRSLKGNRNTYQINPMNRREAIRKSLIDINEGADSLIIKPASYYLDIIRDIRERTNVPLVGYQVSGEYAMIKFAAQSSSINEHDMILESLGSIKRSGADMIISYFALNLAENKII